MALDKIVDSAVLDAGMTSVADAIRAKAGTADTLLWPDGFKTAIEAISGDGGIQFNYITTFIPSSTGYISATLFGNGLSQMNLKPTYMSGMFFSRGNIDISSDTGNFMLLLFYTSTRYFCMVSGSYNNSIQSAQTVASDRTETGIGGAIGVGNVGTIRNGYTIVGKQYNVYEVEISDDVVSRLIDYVEETA